jgi:aerobic carbon-monoxide dehydrogenase large subunit
MSTEHPAANRREDRPLLVGEGTFIDGLNLPELEGAYHAVFVRSIEPHARLISIDTADASAMPGVVAVFTGADLRLELWPLPPRLPIMNVKMVRSMVAHDIVRFVGEPVAVVIATTKAVAMDAAEAVIVDYDPLPVISDIEESRRDEALLHADAGTNVSYFWETPPFEDDPFAACDVVLDFALRHPRLSASPIEPRAGASIWSSAEQALTAYVCSQRPAGAKYVMECSLGLGPGKVRAIAPDVGGGFGAKGGYGCYPEDVVVAWVARHLDHPTRWCETRTEAMLAMGHGRASTHTVKIGATRDGVVQAYSVKALQDSGAYPAMGTFITSNLKNSGTGTYDIARAYVSGTSVVTNSNSTNAFRGAGRPEAACSIERAMDNLALTIGVSPVEIRRRNFVPPTAFPYKTAVGSVYDSGDYRVAFDLCLEAAGYDALLAEQAARRAAGNPVELGIGVSCTVESTGGGEEESTITVNADGTVTLIVGTSPHGQGHETTFAKVVADQLGLAPDAVTVLHSDTKYAPFGGGTIGSRSTQLGGSASYRAAEAAIESAKRKAASLLEAAEEDVVFDAGRFHVAGTPSRSLGWTDLGEISEVAKFTAAAAYAFGACVAAVELDTETGSCWVRSLVCVDDAGTILQPQMAEGQVHGGLGLAVGAVLFEEMQYENGVPRTSNFADYGIPSAAEMPSFTCIEMETPSPLSPLGVKGIGESGTVVGTPALHSAVLDALRPHGVTEIDLPCSPMRVWEALQAVR